MGPEFHSADGDPPGLPQFVAVPDAMRQYAGV